MTRHYRTQPGSKRCQKHDPKKLDEAAADIKAGLSYRQAVKKYKIAKSVLWRHTTHITRKLGIPRRNKGGQCTLDLKLESLLVANLILCADWGYPLTCFDLRVIVKMVLDKRSVCIPKFKANLPGKDWAKSFLNRHKKSLSERLCQNIRRNRAGVTRANINEYFDKLEESLKDVPPENIANYDETNLSDDPGRKHVITKRGCKYSERVMNSSKSATSMMFAATADGTLLRLYVVYKATNMYDPWKKNGPHPPLHARYNRTKSGWFDAETFNDWLYTIAIPHLKKFPGKKVLLGDNLSSHLSLDAIQACKEHNIHFVFLLANSTDKTQPLDVAFFSPLKHHWRAILTEWKLKAGLTATYIPKPEFPPLLKKLMERITPNAPDNIRKGFEKCEVYPLNRDKVLARLLVEDVVDENSAAQVNSSVTDLLKEMRHPTGPQVPKCKKKVNVAPGKSVGESDFENSSDSGDNSDSEDENRYDSDHNHVQDSSSGEESDSEPSEAVLSADFIFKGKKMSGVRKVDREIKPDDWVLVHFVNNPRKASAKETLLIGLVSDVTEHDVISVNFVKYEQTKINNGQIFMWPNKDDISDVPIQEIVGFFEPPQLLRRSKMLFQVDVNEW